MVSGRKTVIFIVRLESSWWVGQFMVGWTVHCGVRKFMVGVGSSWGRGGLVNEIGERDSNIHDGGGQFMVGWTVHGRLENLWWGGKVDSSRWGGQFMVGWTVPCGYDTSWWG